MKKSQVGHTPGPWVVKQLSGSETVVMGKRNFQDCLIAQNLYDENIEPTQDELEANASLIAAAPELLDLLKRINYSFYVDGTSKALRPIMSETKAAIAKAEGR